MIFFSKKHESQKHEPQPPANFADAPEVFRQYWTELADPRRIRREMATLLLAEMRHAGPDWPTDRFDMLNKILEKTP